MARKHTYRDYASESDPALNRQFSRRWSEPDGHGRKTNAPRHSKRQTGQDKDKAA